MKLRTVGIVSALAMTLTSVTVWSLTPKGGIGNTAVARANDLPGGQVEAPVERWSFVDGKTLTVEGRLGHSMLSADRGGESYVYVNVKAAAGAVAKQTAPLNLAIAIDHSGSMAGKRMSNAIDAARGALSRLRDGDVVSITVYNHTAELLVPATTITTSSRSEIAAKLQGIQAEGETCISCGIDTAMSQLRGRDDMVKRILMLSDGEPTVGLRGPEEFARQAERAREMGCSISAIGVDVEYNEKVMSAIARGSNGRHTFVDNPDQLASVLEQEARALADTIATGAELRVELAPEVEVAQVFDRAFRREGNTLVVPLGSFSTSDDKTLLVKVRVPRGSYGQRAIADVRLSFRDFVNGNEGSSQGKLAMNLSKDGQSSPFDPLVAGRVERSETAAILNEGNRRFALGDVDGARRLIDSRRSDLKAKAVANNEAAPIARKGDVDKDFGSQQSALDDASSSFAAPPPAPVAGAAPVPVQNARPGKAALKRAAEQADAFSR
jgi:Ca-activated chloride channel family protein